ncbi:hypothetical protein [Limoniibacter endophyticus]|uniref:DUF4401 domain-containing protein n=1 Tax=Limoniibacter endophyticus TaxID=1565040 RepID=A0A8J3GF96_9HYPH|nr:hypothetical protein [Limoniibacter endophyticus]GHC65614.1 hypothetical protein GCM10010136_08430 [Limoniibacter endophyticus]
MTDLRNALASAADRNLISHEQARTLEPFLEEKLGPQPETLRAWHDDEWPAVEETEAPRFVRGFHDILITIGVVIGLLGIWGVSGPYGGILASVLLSEILVRRQRLALPAVVLSVLFTLFVSAAGLTLYSVETAGLDEALSRMLAMVLTVPVLLLPYYLRYKTPIALGIILTGIFASVFVAMLKLIDMIYGLPQMVDDHPLAMSSLALVTALALFTLAMRFDLSDRLRVTRRSDVAFWLHLITAPALLGSMLSFTLSPALHDASIETVLYGKEPLLVIAIVACFMGIGVLIDRRAFVTSGLLSLGISIGTLLYNDTAPDFMAYVTMLIVGIIVLTIGIGWQFFRAQALKLLPAKMRDRLPPVRL